MKAEVESAEADIAASFQNKTLTQKRKAIIDALVAVVAVPGGKGTKVFDYQLLKPVWRTSE
ncbi:hypothetical protein [Streptomyces sp. NPDC094032]|uniref:hypothetical protein n=1 Tax=Streptomyces sp. NPDC094032 TaxID=3155308 RepID=UPI00331AFE59